MNTNEQILSQCVYDVDNRYVSMYIRPGFGGGFILKMSDTSDEDLKTIIDRLSERLKP